MADSQLSKWGTLLMVLGYITALMTLAAPLGLLFGDAPLALARGADIWTTTLHKMKFADASFCVFILMLPNVVWVYCVAQIIRLARNVREGRIFVARNTVCFMKIGIGLALVGITSALVLPALNYYLFFNGVSPWLADMSLWGLLEPDLFMAGAFFYVLGKIMQRAVDLEELSKLTV